MASKLYVYSTLTADQLYTNWGRGGGDVPVPTSKVFIKGGAGVANDRVITPRGVVTEITPEQAAILMENSDFQLHQKNGFVQISERETDPEKAAADMESRDESAPLVPGDLPADMQPTMAETKPEPRSKKR